MKTSDTAKYLMTILGTMGLGLQLVPLHRTATSGFKNATVLSENLTRPTVLDV